MRTGTLICTVALLAVAGCRSVGLVTTRDPSAVTSRLLSVDRQAACDEILSWRRCTVPGMALTTDWTVNHVVECRGRDGERILAVFEGHEGQSKGGILLIREDGVQINGWGGMNYLEKTDHFTDINADGVMDTIASVWYQCSVCGEETPCMFTMLVVIPVTTHRNPILRVAFGKMHILGANSWRWHLEHQDGSTIRDVVLERLESGRWGEAARFTWCNPLKRFTGPTGGPEQGFVAAFSGPLSREWKEFELMPPHWPKHDTRHDWLNQAE